MKVKYFLEYEPTAFQKLAKAILKIAAFLFLPYFIIAFLIQDVPIGMRFILHHNLTEPLNPLLFTGTCMVVIGLVLKQFKWRFGELSTTNDTIQIVGKKDLRIPFNTILHTFNYESTPRQFRIDSKCYDITLVFKSIKERDELLEQTKKGI